MTNLYELLAGIANQARNGVPGAAPLSRDRYVTITDEQLEFLENYLKAPDVLINFKARRVGGTDEDPVMAQDFQIAGEGLEVFCLITEAMVNNYQFAQIIQNAVGFYRDHIPNCPICAPKHFGAREPAKDWTFTHAKPEQDGK